MRDSAQLLLGRFQRGARIGVRLQCQQGRKARREPADRAGEIDVLENVLTAVAFEIDEKRRISGPSVERLKERGQENIIHLCAVGLRNFGEQGARFFGSQGAADRTRWRRRRIVGRIGREGIRRGLGEVQPIGQLASELGRPGIFLELLCPDLEGGGLCREMDGLPPFELLVRRL